jgi:hypothetical protein
MNKPNSPAPARDGACAPSGRHLRQLYDEAYQKLEPLLAEAPEQSFSTLMFLALQRLQGHYPHLSHGEIEALFLGLMKRRPPRH